MLLSQDGVAEWLRRWTANPLGFPRVGSNPILVDVFADSHNIYLVEKKYILLLDHHFLEPGTNRIAWTIRMQSPFNFSDFAD